MRYLAGAFALAAVVGASCGGVNEVESDAANSSPPVTSEARAPTAEPAAEEAQEAEGSGDVGAFDETDVPPLDGEPAETIVLEPANALLEEVDGWDRVDEWYHEPLGFEASPDCAPLNTILGIEDWGIPVALFLRNGDELWHHATEVNTPARAVSLVDTFAVLANECSSASFGGAELKISPLEIGTPAFGMTVPEGAPATWLFEPNTHIQLTILQREAVVSIVAIVDRQGGDHSEELVEIAKVASARLEQVPPESRAGLEDG